MKTAVYYAGGANDVLIEFYPVIFNGRDVPALQNKALDITYEEIK